MGIKSARQGMWLRIDTLMEFTQSLIVLVFYEESVFQVQGAQNWGGAVF